METPNFSSIEGNKFQCPFCLNFFSSKYSVKDHILHVHEEKKKTFECSICSKVLGSKPTLKRHIAQVHEGKRPFKCNVCDESFKVKKALNTHVTKVHKEKIDVSIEQQNYNFFLQERKLFDRLYTIDKENMIGQGGYARVLTERAEPN